MHPCEDNHGLFGKCSISGGLALSRIAFLFSRKRCGGGVLVPPRVGLQDWLPFDLIWSISNRGILQPEASTAFRCGGLACSISPKTFRATLPFPLPLRKNERTQIPFYKLPLAIIWRPDFLRLLSIYRCHVIVPGHEPAFGFSTISTLSLISLVLMRCWSLIHLLVVLSWLSRFFLR